MNSILSIALNGLNTAINRVDKAAHNIATSTLPDKPDTMVEDIVDIKAAEHAFKANLAVMRTAQDMHEDLIDSLDTTA